MYQINNSYITISIAFLICFLSACHIGHDHEGHDHGEHNHQTDDAHNHSEADNHNSDDKASKSVYLNEAQFLNAEIDTGWFIMKNLKNVIRSSGYTKLDPQDQAEVSMPVSGTIKSINVIEGDYVKRGTTLATMESLEYSKMLLENNALQLEQKALQLEQNKLLLDKATLKIEKSKVEENIAVSEAHSAYLQLENNRQQALAIDNINARKVYEKINSELNAELAKISALRNQLSEINQALALFGENNNSFQSIAINRESNLPNINAGDAQKIPIIAPISGYITHVDLKIGATVQAGQDMFSIVDNSKMHADLLVYEKDLLAVKVGQKVRFNLSNQSNQEIQGEIYNIGKAFANETKSVAVHADIEKNNFNLIPGMFINALIDIDENTVRAVPEEAVVQAEGRTFIFLYDKENDEAHEAFEVGDDANAHDHSAEISFNRLEVKTGVKQLGYVEITPLAEIEEGDKIVLNGAYYLQSHLQKAEGGGGHHH